MYMYIYICFILKCSWDKFDWMFITKRKSFILGRTTAHPTPKYFLLVGRAQLHPIHQLKLIFGKDPTSSNSPAIFFGKYQTSPNSPVEIYFC